MRKVATLAIPIAGIRRLMLHEVVGGTYLFRYTITDDGPCEHDDYYETTADAEKAAAESFGVNPEDWVVIDDPVAGAQQDWIGPVQVKRDSAGNELWVEFEFIPPAV